MNTAMKLAAIPVATVALWGFSSLAASARVRLQRRRRLLAYSRGLRLSAGRRHNHPSGRLAGGRKASTTLGVNIPAEATGKGASGRRFRPARRTWSHLRFPNASE